MITLRRILILALISACGTSALPAGAVCDETGDCDSGLSCLDVAQFMGTACTVVGKACSTTCTNDASCAPLGANFKCFASCTADKFCGEVATP